MRGPHSHHLMTPQVLFSSKQLSAVQGDMENPDLD
jgi:hypothetical protein